MAAAVTAVATAVSACAPAVRLQVLLAPAAAELPAERLRWCSVAVAAGLSAQVSSAVVFLQ